MYELNTIEVKPDGDSFLFMHHLIYDDMRHYYLTRGGWTEKVGGVPFIRDETNTLSLEDINKLIDKLEKAKQDALYSAR